MRTGLHGSCSMRQWSVAMDRACTGPTIRRTSVGAFRRHRNRERHHPRGHTRTQLAGQSIAAFEHGAWQVIFHSCEQDERFWPGTTGSEWPKPEGVDQLRLEKKTGTTEILLCRQCLTHLPSADTL